ncbi:Cytochrome P450 52E2 [Talaromyces pinophilus]|nr:Cytochrome P450 52E2 [Talaromyces pinophilus]
MYHYVELVGILAALYIASLVYKFVSLRIRYAKAAQQHGCKPISRYPNREPFMGTDLSRLMKEEAKRGRGPFLFMNLHRKYGDTFSFKAQGPAQISTCDPKNVQTIASTKFGDWGVQPIRGEPLAPFLGRGVLTHDGPIWKRSRALLRPTFNRTEVADLENFETHVSSLLRMIPKDRETVDLQPLFKNLFLDTSTEFIFGRSVGSLDPASSFPAPEFMKAFDAASMGFAQRLKAGALAPILFYFDKTWEQAYTVVHNFVDKEVQRALLPFTTNGQTKSKGDHKEKFILLDQMARETQDPLDLRHQVLNIFLPARGVTAVGISNVMWELARHPNSWEALREEVRNIGDQPLTFELMLKLKVAKKIINETFRLHPPAPVVTRIALKDTVLPSGGGHSQKSPVFVPKGTTALLNLYALHTHPELWGEDANEFKPERWADSKLSGESSWQYQPFFGGPRMCPGQQMALVQITYLLVRIVQEFKGLENTDPVNDYYAVGGVTVASMHGVKVSLTPA